MKRNTHSGLKHLAISRVSSNDTVPLIYLSKEVQKRTGLGKGARVLVSLDRKGRLVIEPIDEADEQAMEEYPK